MKKKILVTGGCGFAGSHFVEHLCKSTDWDIWVLDGLRYASDMRRLTTMGGISWDRVKVRYHDLREKVPVWLAREIGSVDYLVNFASESHVDRSIEDPVPFVHNNVMLMLNILEYARIVRPKKFIQISTDEVYGPAPLEYAHKEWDTYLPSNPYSASKTAQEAIGISYWRTYGVPLIITNTMNLFGERQHPEKMVPKTIKALKAGKPAIIHAAPIREGWVPGSRYWLHARNLASALVFLLERADPLDYPVMSCPTKIHIAGEREIDNHRIAEMIADFMGVKLNCQFEDCHSQRPGHDPRYALDDSFLRVHLGWEPPLTVEESLRRTVEWTLAHPEWLELA